MENRLSKRIKITPEVLTKIARIDELKGLWQGSLRLSPHILSRLKRSVIITSTGASTRIEGAEMTDEEIARFLRGLKSNPPKNRDEEEVAGYADLTGRIFDNYKDFKLTEGQILQFHDILLQFSKKDALHRGKYKSQDNIVAARADDGREQILFRPTPPYLVKKEMDDMLVWAYEQFAKKELHPILVLCNFIFEFLAIHPFEDGNGRLSRALTNLLLLQQGYSYVPYVSLEEIIEDSQEEYYRALRATQQKHKTPGEDITPWVLYMLDVLLKQAERASRVMDSEKPEKLLSEKQLLVYHLFQEDAELSVAGIDAKLKRKIPKATLKQALSRLVTLQMLERIGQGRATRYRKL
ncbi:MAG TPA: Fic family protein [Candidatus Paceibacterota bacterium]